MMSKAEYVAALERRDKVLDVAFRYGLMDTHFMDLLDAAYELIARHDKRARLPGLTGKCGCEDCKPFRTIIEQVQR